MLELDVLKKKVLAESSDIMISDWVGPPRTLPVVLVGTQIKL